MSKELLVIQKRGSREVNSVSNICLSKTKEGRLVAYCELFKVHIDRNLLKGIRDSVNQGANIGNEQFTQQKINE